MIENVPANICANWGEEYADAETSELNAAAITVQVVLSAYLIVGTRLEKRKLVIEFGDEYRRYQDRVSMFIPLKWLTARPPDQVS
jgi:hypothetical protein